MATLKATVPLTTHQPSAFQYIEVLGDGGQRDGEGGRQLSHRHRPPRQAVDDATTRTVRQRMKYGIESAIPFRALHG